MERIRQGSHASLFFITKKDKSIDGRFSVWEALGLQGRATFSRWLH